MNGQSIGVGDSVAITDDYGQTTNQQGIIIAELSKAHLDACNLAAKALDAEAFWPGGVRVFVVFLNKPVIEDENSERLKIYCDAFLVAVRKDPNYSRN